MDESIVILILSFIAMFVVPFVLFWGIIVLHNKRRYREKDLQIHGGTIKISGMEPIYIPPDAEVKVGFASIRIRHNGVERRIEINGWATVCVEVSYYEYR